jgi:hemoglobin-like flavoprotein
MNTYLIEKTWNDVSAHHQDIVESFYTRLFHRHPTYQQLFSPGDMQKQMQRMVQTLALVSRHADSPAAIEPHLRRLGAAHQGLGLGSEDFDRFSGLLIEVIGEYCRAADREWSEDCEHAWRQAFEQIVQPMMSVHMTR